MQAAGWNRLLFLANPANPVGNKMGSVSLETLLDVCEKKQITVVLDECFIAFTGTEGYVSWIRKYPHLIVVRAYTKDLCDSGNPAGVSAGAERNL